MMESDARYPTDAQRRMLCEMMHYSYLELRHLGWSGKAEQAGDLADAFHNLPVRMWQDDFSLQFFRDAFLSAYQEKYPEGRSHDYVAMVDEIIALPEG